MKPTTEWKIGLAALAIAGRTAFGGYGDLPDEFNDSTGYVTLTRADLYGTDAGVSSFFTGTRWSDTEAPQSGKKYYTGTYMFVTPRNADEIAAKAAADPGWTTFKGDILVAAGEVRGQSPNTLTFTDLRMLPGSSFYWAGIFSPLDGTVTIYGDAQNPVRMRSRLSTADVRRQEFAMGIVGGEEARLDLHCDLIYKSKGTSGFIALTGDLSGYYGTLKVATEGYSALWATYGWELAVSAANATVYLEDNTCLYATASDGVTIRNLDIEGTNVTIRLNASSLSTSAARLTVTNSLTFVRPAALELCTHTVAANGKYTFTPANPTLIEDVALLRLSPEATAGIGTYDFDSVFMPPKSLTQSETVWRDDIDGGKTLWLVPCVTNSVNDTGDRPAMTYVSKTEGGQVYWSDGNCPADDENASTKSYYSKYELNAPASPAGTAWVFPGKSLTIVGNNLLMMGKGWGFRCDDLVLRGATLRMASANVYNPGWIDENGGQYAFYRVQGRIRLPLGYTNTFQTYGDNKVLRIESEMSGGGDIVLNTFLAGIYVNDRGFHHFAALNTNFTGKIAVTMPYNSTKYASSGVTVPNRTQRSRLFVADERNLGGKRSSFAWDALLVEHWSELSPVCDVEFTDGWNRGMAIGDVGRFLVTNGITLSIRRPFNVAGHLIKEGGGTLALGGVLTFGGAAQNSTPVSGMNLLTVDGGAIKPLSAHAFDGLAITFTNNAALRINGAPSDADLLRYGLVNLKEDTAPVSLAANQAMLPVTITCDESAVLPEGRYNVGIVTLESSKAAAIANKVVLTNPRLCKGMRAKNIEVVPNGDGTSTVTACYEPVGCLLIGY